MSAKRRSVKQPKLPATPLDARQRHLEEEARKLKEQMSRCEAFIEKAPEIKQQRALREREALIKARSRGASAIPGSRTALPDPRYRPEPPLRARVAATGPRLRSERAQGKLMFFFLVAILAGVMTWAYYFVIRG